MLLINSIILAAVAGLATAGDPKYHLKFCTFKDLTLDCQERTVGLYDGCKTLEVDDWKRYGDKDSSFMITPNNEESIPGYVPTLRCMFYEKDGCTLGDGQHISVGQGIVYNFADKWTWKAYSCFDQYEPMIYPASMVPGS